MADGQPHSEAETKVARLADGVRGVDAAAWNRLAGPDNPFVSHEFLALLEQSGSVGPRTGWQAAPLLIEQGGTLIGALPAYLKTHSQGEYIFDHGWAEAYERAGGAYYPKLQIAVPFTPVPGPRILAQDEATKLALLRAAEAVVDQNGLSSAHATFIEPQEIALFDRAGWLIRTGSQFHWDNRGYGNFDDFLDSLASRKRKAIRKERASAQSAVDIVALSGADIKPEHWDAMWRFYQDTGARKWGTPYLTRAAFDLMGATMAEHILLLLAYKGGEPVAGALNFIGADTLYGRYWGAREAIPNLHFELCYYQAIDIAIERGLARVEAGAQGEHKLARGYAPVPTYSAHYLPDPGFRAAVADFLEREKQAVAGEIDWLQGHTPFKRGGE